MARVIRYGLLCCFLVGCNSSSAELKELCSLEYGKRLEAFRSYPIEKRYDLFMESSSERSCDADSVQGRGYLINELVLDDKDIDYLASRLEMSRDERMQQDIIEIFFRNRDRLKGKDQIIVVARRKADAMKGSLVDRVLFDTSTIERTKEMVSELEKFD